MALRAFIAAGLLAVAGFCRAQAFTVGDPSLIDGSATIYQINLASRATSPVGTAGTAGTGHPIVALGALAFSPDHTLYALALTGNTSPTLVTLNQGSGKATTVSQVAGVSSSAAKNLSLSFGCDGKLWMAAADTNNFWELTPGTGQIRPVGNLGAKITSLAFRNNVLYGIGGSGNANLYSIDLNTGKATSIGAYGASVSTPVDAGFDGSGTLWSLVRNFNGNDPPSKLNSLAQINTTSGALTPIGDIPDPSGNPAIPQTLQGLAIASPSCSAAPPPDIPVGAPMLSPAGLAAFVLSLLAAAALMFSARVRD
jgi:hypothetical protein